MSRADFERQLQALQDDLLTLGSMVEKAIAKSIHALKQRDLEESRRLIEEDTVIDQKRYEVEERCIDLIATQQPMARDLRYLVSVLFIANELERMGDHAEGIAKISVMMGDQPPLKPLIDVPRMAEKAAQMLRGSLDALIKRDVQAAYAICKADDEVDALYDQVYHELLFFMMQDPRTIERATFLLWVAHNLERVGDRATNIAERVIFMVTGKLGDAASSKY
ncbi:MAG: phosphate signaling complex protein PhoU [Chloroflexota bacterium]|nr:phosphate signaling complex protein PhoU [Chloroflexota bacterium]